MRSIKFRGKCKETGEWIYGSYFEKIRPDCVDRTFWSAWILDGALSGTEVIPETVGQFTGLKDKEGEELYEGDLLNVHIFGGNLSANLGWSEGERDFEAQLCFQELGLWLQGESEDDCGYILWFDGIHEDSFELIGSKFDNPELLK